MSISLLCERMLDTGADEGVCRSQDFKIEKPDKLYLRAKRMTEDD